MIKFVGGLITGLLVALAAYSYSATIGRIQPVQIAAENPDPENLLSAEFMYGNNLSVVTTNLRYNDERIEAGLGIDGLPPAGYPYFAVTANDPLLALSRKDIQKVCISVQPPSHPDDIPTFYVANIFLTPETREKVGNAVIQRAGREVSVRLFGIEIHSFFANQEKAQLAIDNRAIYNEDPDFDLIVPEHAYFVGFSMLKMVLGTDTLETCDPAVPLENFTPYVDHHAFWDEVKKGFN